MKWQEKDRKYVVYLCQGSWCPSYLSLLHEHVLVISNMIRYNVQMWYPICLIYNLVACWAFSEIQGHMVIIFWCHLRWSDEPSYVYMYLFLDWTCNIFKTLITFWKLKLVLLNIPDYRNWNFSLEFKSTNFKIDLMLVYQQNCKYCIIYHLTITYQLVHCTCIDSISSTLLLILKNRMKCGSNFS